MVLLIVAIIAGSVFLLLLFLLVRDLLPNSGESTLTITATCPNFGNSGKYSDELLGKKGACKTCQGLFVIGDHPKAAKREAAPSHKLPDLNDTRITKPIAALSSHVKIISPGTYQFTRNSSTAALAEEIGDLSSKYRSSAELHYLYAAALQLNLLGEQANRVLRECVASHPAFWLAAAVMKRNCLHSWNPLIVPEFAPNSSDGVHDSIDSIVSRTLLLTVRRGCMPRAIVFHRDANDELQVSALRECRIDFITIISPVKQPQVVAINACIYDNPSNPFRTEILACPFGTCQNAQRFAYELFVRQDSFEFVVLDRIGRIKYARTITPSIRMTTVHRQLVQMFDATDGTDFPESAHLRAVREHTASVNPNTLVY